MPNIIEKETSDVESEADEDLGEIPATAVTTDQEIDEQVNGELDKAFKDDDKEEVAKGEGGEDEEDEGGEEEEDSDDETNEEEYVVEAIRDHRFNKKRIELEIKWKGYAEAENTWEPEENLLPASNDLLQSYYKSIGGRPGKNKPPAASKKRKSVYDEELSDAKKKPKENGTPLKSEWLPKQENWEPLILKVDTVDRDPETYQLFAYIHFKNGKMNRVSMDMVYKHCPRAMLQFYEDHLRFK